MKEGFKHPQPRVDLQHVVLPAIPYAALFMFINFLSLIIIGPTGWVLFLASACWWAVAPITLYWSVATRKRWALGFAIAFFALSTIIVVVTDIWHLGRVGRLDEYPPRSVVPVILGAVWYVALFFVILVRPLVRVSRMKFGAKLETEKQLPVIYFPSWTGSEQHGTDARTGEWNVEETHNRDTHFQDMSSGNDRAPRVLIETKWGLLFLPLICACIVVFETLDFALVSRDLSRFAGGIAAFVLTAVVAWLNARRTITRMVAVGSTLVIQVARSRLELTPSEFSGAFVTSLPGGLVQAAVLRLSRSRQGIHTLMLWWNPSRSSQEAGARTFLKMLEQTCRVIWLPGFLLYRSKTATGRRN
jgi:hypothetical protein